MQTVGGRVARGEEEHRKIVPIGAHPPTDFKAIDVGEHYVEHHDVWHRVRRIEAQRVGPCADNADLKTRMPKRQSNHIGDVLFVFDKKDARPAGHDGPVE